MGQPTESNGRLLLRRGTLLGPADQGRWQIRWGFDDVSFLDGTACVEILPWLVPKLDGSMTAAELLDAPDRPCSPEELRNVLRCLEEHRCLTHCLDDDLTAVLENMGLDASVVLERVRRVRIAVYGRSSLADMVVASIRLQGMTAGLVGSWEEFAAWSSDAGPQNFAPVVIEPDWPVDRLEALNAWALGQRQKWMLVGAWNRRVLVGPIIVPGETACYVCYRKRLDSHRKHRLAYEVFDTWRRGQQVSVEPQPVLPAIAGLAAAWTGFELLALYSSSFVARTIGRVLVYYPDECRLEGEQVLRIPWCPACGTMGVERSEREFSSPA